MWEVLKSTGFVDTDEVIKGVDYSVLDNWEDILM